MSPIHRPQRQRRFFLVDGPRFDASDRPQTVEVAPAATVARDGATWDVDPRVADPERELAEREPGLRSFANPPLRCSRIPGGLLATRAAIAVTEDGRWLVESLGGAPVADATETRRWGRIVLDEPAAFLDEDVAVVYSVLSEKKATNHYHWVVEGLTRAAILLAAGVPESVRILLPEPVADVHRQSLLALGIAEQRILPWNGAPTRFRTVYLPTGPQHRGSRPSAAAIALLRERTAAPSGGPRRLWISRRLARRRRKRLLGEDALLAVIREFDFEEVAPEELSVQEQIATFASADAIGGIHGAGLANAVFMAPGTSVVEAAPESLKPRQKPIFWNLAAAGRQRYGVCVGPQAGLDPARFARVLARLLS